jgi:hypothetical protein
MLSQSPDEAFSIVVLHCIKSCFESAWEVAGHLPSMGNQDKIAKVIMEETS